MQADDASLISNICIKTFYYEISLEESYTIVPKHVIVGYFSEHKWILIKSSYDFR